MPLGCGGVRTPGSGTEGSGLVAMRDHLVGGLLMVIFQCQNEQFVLN